MIRLVAYDIEDNRLRNRIARLLEGYGERVQESVFECRLEGNRMDELTERLRKEMTGTTGGHVRLYRICSACHEASFSIGPTRRTPNEEVCIIV